MATKTTETLTDKGIQALKPREHGKGGPDTWGGYSVPDSKMPGLDLRVLPTGTKTWSFRYKVGKRFRRVSLGTYPAIGLARARKLAGDRMFEVRQGGDPSRAKREALAAPDATFRGLCAMYLDEHALGPKVGPRQRSKSKNGLAPGTLLSPDGTAADIWSIESVTGEPRKRSWKDDRRMLEREIPAPWWRRSAEEITRREIIALVNAKGRVHPIGANRLRSLLHSVFNWALELEKVESNPAAKTRRPGDEVKRRRYLSHDELQEFWRLTETMASPFGAWWRMRLLTGQRGGEVTNMRWADLDLERNVWTIPPGDHKGKRGQKVPLLPMAREIIVGIPRIKGEEFVFAGGRGKRQQGEASQALDFPDFRGHDLRTTLSTHLQEECGITEWEVGRVLGHALQTVTGQSYSGAAQYLDHKRRVLQTWEAFLAEVLDLGERAAVVPITRGQR